MLPNTHRLSCFKSSIIYQQAFLHSFGNIWVVAVQPCIKIHNHSEINQAHDVNSTFIFTTLAPKFAISCPNIHSLRGVLLKSHGRTTQIFLTLARKQCNIVEYI